MARTYSIREEGLLKWFEKRDLTDDQLYRKYLLTALTLIAQKLEELNDKGK